MNVPSYWKSMLPSGKNLSLASATRRVVAKPECVPASRCCADCGRPFPGALIVDAFEDKIVADHEPRALGVRRARESTVNRGECDVNCDFRGRSDFHFDFHPWLSSWTADLAVRTISCALGVTSDDNTPLFGAALSLPSQQRPNPRSATPAPRGRGTGPVPGQHRTNGRTSPSPQPVHRTSHVSGPACGTGFTRRAGIGAGGESSES